MNDSSLLYIFYFPAFTSTSANASFPYTEPRIVELLILISFLLFLNVARVVADYVLHGGIIAEIALGMVYGRPLAAILPASWEDTFTVLGYLGLIGIVFEGGLSTELSLLLSNLPLSALCALTGIGLPVAFTFALMTAGFGYRPLESFAAGAALSSTSLGTTLMALNSVTNSAKAVSDEVTILPKRESDNSLAESARSPTATPSLQKSRIGTVLISAAVIDDVIGLVLASLIPALSVLGETFEKRTNLAWTVVRPILSSSLMALVTLVIARFILKPIYWYKDFGNRWCNPRQPGKPWGYPRLLNLVSRRRGDGSTENRWGTQSHADAISVSFMILVISAFATISFYTKSSVLFGAYLAGLTITYVSQPSSSISAPPVHDEEAFEKPCSFEDIYGRTIGPLQQALLAPLFFASIGSAIPFLSLWQPLVLWRGVLYALLMSLAKLCVGVPIMIWGTISEAPVPCTGTRPSFTSRLKDFAYPALFMGTAMVARGEIGLLIAQLARAESSSSTGEELLGDEAFLVCIWAILLCTLLSPIGVGYIVQRMKHKIVQGMWA